MNIVLVGATGAIGSRILDEALRRGHRCPASRAIRASSARARPAGEPASTTEAPAFADVLKGHDAAVVSVKWNENDVIGCSTPCARPA